MLAPFVSLFFSNGVQQQFWCYFLSIFSKGVWWQSGGHYGWWGCSPGQSPVHVRRPCCHGSPPQQKPGAGQGDVDHGWHLQVHQLWMDIIFPWRFLHFTGIDTWYYMFYSIHNLNTYSTCYQKTSLIITLLTGKTLFRHSLWLDFYLSYWNVQGHLCHMTFTFFMFSLIISDQIAV